MSDQTGGEACPHCGEEASEIEGSEGQVACTNHRCANFDNWFSLKDWNTRTPPPAVTELVEFVERVQAEFIVNDGIVTAATIVRATELIAKHKLEGS